MANSTCDLENNRLPLRWSKITARSLVESQYCFAQGYSDNNCLALVRVIRTDKGYLTRLYSAPEEYLPGSESVSESLKFAIPLAHKIMERFNSGYFDTQVPVKSDGSVGDAKEFRELLRMRDKVLGRVSWRF